MNQYFIADLNIGMDSFGVTKTRSKPWKIETSKAADIVIPSASFYSEIKSCDDLMNITEYRRTEVCFSRGLLDYNGFLFHSSSIAFEGKAYCFCGPSGVGKSTHTMLWQKVYGKERVVIIDDDKPALRYMDNKWMVYGTPWSGKTNLSTNCSYELACIFILHQASKNEIKPVDDLHKVKILSENISGPMSAKDRAKSLILLDKLIASVPVFGLCCRPDEEAVKVAYQAILKEGAFHA